jgi:hypothetical protein
MITGTFDTSWFNVAIVFCVPISLTVSTMSLLCFVVNIQLHICHCVGLVLAQQKTWKSGFVLFDIPYI